MDFYQDKFARGDPAEYIVLELCRSRGLHAELNPAPESDLEARRGWDILIEGVPYEIKTDWYSWKSPKFVNFSHGSTVLRPRSGKRCDLNHQCKRKARSNVRGLVMRNRVRPLRQGRRCCSHGRPDLL